MLTIIESVLGKFSTRASSSIVESALYVSLSIRAYHQSANVIL